MLKILRRTLRAAPVLGTLALSTGCSSEVTVTPSTNVGSLAVEVVEGGSLIAGAGVVIRSPDGEIARYTTSADRPLATSGIPGTWTVTVTPPSTYMVLTSQPNPVAVSVSRGQRTNVRVALERAP